MSDKVDLLRGSQVLPETGALSEQVGTGPGEVPLKFIGLHGLYSFGCPVREPSLDLAAGGTARQQPFGFLECNKSRYAHDSN